MLLINQTFETVPPESAEEGEAAERGFIEEGRACSFRELVDILRAHPIPSSYPLRHASARDWFNSHADTDYRTGARTSTAVHYSRENKPRALKYWNKAARAAGLINLAPGAGN